MFRSVLVGVALAVSASAAQAQITTYIAPPRPKTTPQMVATADSARADSAAAVAMTNMKSWVDSAAGVTVPASVGDTSRADSLPPAVVTTFEDGSVAPNTASALPTIAVFGVVVFAAGAVLLAMGRPRS